ncbi:hypothetical protein CYCD_14810 [Tenuifilaceae bacterium CYCD]|nr:hypothetical protein CYCD_14810 [Tenuifilaceae bacterium CYCD]
MRWEIHINPKFEDLSKFISEIPDNYDNLGRLMHKGRNEIKIIEKDETTITIKYFKRITLANRLIYATIRKSKSQRSFENSMHLLGKGIATPEPIAYINSYKHGLLYKSYYISAYSNYKPLSELLELSIQESEKALKAFAKFTHKLHNSGIVHNDYTVSNILYNQEGEEYKFSLIDNNRMSFRKYTYSRKIKDLERLKIPVDKMGIIAAEYAKQSNESDLRTLNAMLFFRIRYVIGNKMRRRIKAVLSF